MNKEMDLNELAILMVEHGLVIRAIPYEQTSVYALRHKNEYPNGVVFYDEVRKCEMVRVVEKNPQGGKFIITQKRDQGRQINGWEWGKSVTFHDTLEQAVKSFVDGLKEK